MKKISLKAVILFLCIMLIIIFAVFVLIISASNKNNKYVSTVSGNQLINNTIEIMDIPVFELFEGEYRDVFYVNHNFKQKVTYRGQEIKYFKFSPSKKRLGFYYESGNYLSAGRDVALAVMNIAEQSVKKIYKGSFKTSDWEWLNDEEIAVYYGCGTECMAVYIIDVDSGGKEAALQYGVNYEWSPDKELALAYNYSGKYGITVGDKKGNAVFSIKRDLAAPYDLIYKTNAEWSPNGGKLALIIQKEKQDRLELLVFNVQEDFKQIFQFDVNFSDDIELRWSDNDSIIIDGQEFVLK